MCLLTRLEKFCYICFILILFYFLSKMLKKWLIVFCIPPPSFQSPPFPVSTTILKCILSVLFLWLPNIFPSFTKVENWFICFKILQNVSWFTYHFKTILSDKCKPKNYGNPRTVKMNLIYKYYHKWILKTYTE